MSGSVLGPWHILCYEVPETAGDDALPADTLSGLLEKYWGDPVRKTARKRMHSKCYHMERSRCENAGMPTEDAKQRAVLFARQATDLWDARLAK